MENFDLWSFELSDKATLKVCNTVVVCSLLYLPSGCDA
jgi:hypothetical protein